MDNWPRHKEAGYHSCGVGIWIRIILRNTDNCTYEIGCAYWSMSQPMGFEVFKAQTPGALEQKMQEDARGPLQPLPRRTTSRNLRTTLCERHGQLPDAKNAPAECRGVRSHRADFGRVFTNMGHDCDAIQWLSHVQGCRVQGHDTNQQVKQPVAPQSLTKGYCGGTLRIYKPCD